MGENDSQKRQILLSSTLGMVINGERTIGSAERVFDIIEVLRNHDGATASTVADEVDAAVSTAYQYLQTIENKGFIFEDDGKYYVSLQFLDYGGYARTLQPANVFAEKKVNELAIETGERAQYVVPQFGLGVVLYTSAEDNAVRTGVRAGAHMPLHATAAGKAILAYLPDQDVYDIIETHGLQEFTEHTITDANELLTKLDTIREEEVAYNDQEQMKRLRAVGVPVRNHQNKIIGALSVSAPLNRLVGNRFTEEIPNLLLGTANEMELTIEYNEQTK